MPPDRGALLSPSTEKETVENLEGEERSAWREDLRTLKERYEVHMVKLAVVEAVDAIVSVLNHVRPPFFLALLPSLQYVYSLVLLTHWKLLRERRWKSKFKMSLIPTIARDVLPRPL